MSVATWLRSLFTTQDPTTYKSAIDGNFAVLERVGAMFAAQQAAAPNMTVIIRAGSIMNNGALVEVAQQTTITITAPVSTSRIDRIVIDQQTGIYTIVAGVVSGSPVAPAIPAGKLPCAQLLLQSTSTTITNAMITDERVFVSTSTVLYAPLDSPTFTGIVTIPNGGVLGTPASGVLTNCTGTAAGLNIGGNAATADNGVKPGTIIDFAGTSAPAGYLACPVAAANISRTTYAALFAAIGTTWGAGDGSTTFGMPWFPAEYAAIQYGGGGVGTSSAGQVLSHSHPQVGGGPVTGNSNLNPGFPVSGATVASTVQIVNTGSAYGGGIANLAAGQRILKCVKY
jgi:hypothetical protein